MNFVGDYFALGLIIILFVYFFDSKINFRFMTPAAKLYIGCLITTALTAIFDLLTEQLQAISQVPLWLNMLVNSLYFTVNIITTTIIALYLFTKILEHTHARHCMRNACIGLAILFTVYMCFVAANVYNG